jgi:hypothetical protein
MGLLMRLILVALILVVFAAPLMASDLEEVFPYTLTFRDAFLPPGAPSVAMHFDETAVLWNPAGIAMSEVYALAYAWKGTYFDDDLKVQSHFLLTKSHGFGLGLRRDNYSRGVKTTTFFSLAPPITKDLAIGWTGKWRGGFNFDAGAMLVLGRRLSVGFVGRNLRERKNVRRYWESGLAAHLSPGRLSCYFDVVVEDSPWREVTALGGGFDAALEHGVSIGFSYFTDGEGHGITRGALKIRMPGNLMEGEYTEYTNNFQTMGLRLTARSP